MTVPTDWNADPLRVRPSSEQIEEWLTLETSAFDFLYGGQFYQLIPYDLSLNSWFDRDIVLFHCFNQARTNGYIRQEV